MKVLLLLALCLPYALAQTTQAPRPPTCSDVNPVNNNPNDCLTAQPLDGNCCRCFGGGGACEGCEPISCSPSLSPTTQDPTTSSPTQDPTDDPSSDPTKFPSEDPTSDPTDDPTRDPTTDPTSNPVTPQPTQSTTSTSTSSTTSTTSATTTAAATTTTAATTSTSSGTTSFGSTPAPTPCTCPDPPPACVVAADGEKPDGCGTGECECDEKLQEIRYRYSGAVSGVDISIQTGKPKDGVQEVCVFTGVIYGQEIICNIRDASRTTGELKTTGLSVFANESPFVITRPDGSTCSAQYHTSCSQDIVGIAQAACPDLVVSGWRDGAWDKNGGECMDSVGKTEFCTSCGPPPTTTTYAPGNCTCPEPPQPCIVAADDEKPEPNCGIGECDCEEKVQELRFRWSGQDGVTIMVSTGKKDPILPLCEFVGVVYGQEIICNVRDAARTSGRLITTGLSIYENETPIKVTGPSGNTICQVQYHTSCSQDIVGIAKASCPELVVSGWRDGAWDKNGGECTDSVGLTEFCLCQGPTPPPTPPSKIEKKIGDVCYCTDPFPPPASDSPGAGSGSTSSKSKSKGKKRRRLGGKSKGKKGSGKSKDAGTGGVGDCECDNKLGELTVRWSGTQTDVNLKFYSESSTPICELNNIAVGEEATCNGRVATNSAAFEFDKDTDIVVSNATTGKEICTQTFHTSCSQDLVGTTGDGMCADFVTVTAWRDNDNLDADISGTGSRCDDGLFACPCLEGYMLLSEENSKSSIVEYLNEICFCREDLSSTITQDSGTTGVGECGCSTTGIKSLSFMYMPRSHTDFVSPVEITVCGDANCAEVFATEIAAAGEEFVINDVTFGGTVNRQRLPDTLYFVTEDPLTLKTWNGTLQTTCSVDLIGSTLVGDFSITITGFEDLSGNGLGDTGDFSTWCVDGFTPCTCEACGSKSIVGGQNSECAATASCFVNENANICQSISAGVYASSNANMMEVATTMFALMAAYWLNM